MHSHKLIVLRDLFCVLKLKNENEDLSWLNNAVWHSITKTEDELSVICPENIVPESLSAEKEHGWRSIKLDGVFDFSLIGVLSEILHTLARANVSILALSTYNTDYVFVKENKLNKAIEALKQGGYTITDWRRKI
jgi:hypothetical protein